MMLMRSTLSVLFGGMAFLSSQAQAQAQAETRDVDNDSTYISNRLAYIPNSFIMVRYSIFSL